MANYSLNNTGSQIQNKLDYNNVDSNNRLYKSVFFANEDLAKGNTPPDSLLIAANALKQYDVGDDSKWTWAIPSDCDTTQDIQCFLWWGCNEAYSTNSGEVQWQLEVYLDADGEILGDANGYVALNLGDLNIDATAKTIVKTDIGDIGTAQITINDMVGFKLSNLALDDGNSPTSDPYIIAVEIKYVSNKAGETI